MMIIRKVLSMLLIAFALPAAVVWWMGCDHGHDHADHDHGESQPETSDQPLPPDDDSYPLKTCVVSGEALGSNGKPKILTHEGQVVKLCCADCEKEFRKDPSKFLKMITEAKQKP